MAGEPETRWEEPVRLDKLREQRSLGFDPFGTPYRQTARAAQVSENCDAMAGQEVHVAGRIHAMRLHGGSMFLDLRDETGRIQLYARRDGIGEEQFRLLDLIDIGDIVAAEGSVFRTRRGEPSVDLTRILPLAKALRPPPEKFHGLNDVEVRLRHRYLDLIANPEVHRTFRARSAVIRSLRRTLDDRGYLEVETPVLHTLAGGAAARPFATHHNALAIPLYLRIALELHLKRLLVGGFERVYEIGRVFRNEGISSRHNPEFTMLECYEAYASLEDIMELTESLVCNAARSAVGSLIISFAGREIDLTPPWRRIDFRTAILENGGPDIDAIASESGWRDAARAAGIDAGQPVAKLIDDLFEHFAQPNLAMPTIVFGHPAAMSPLARRRPSDPRYAERFEAFIAGMEVGNAFFEQNDPEQQRAAFEEQMRQRALGDDEVPPLDEDYLFALEHGMPPAGGLGVGVDRLVMLLLDQQSIREVILFPLQRPRS